ATFAWRHSPDEETRLVYAGHRGKFPALRIDQRNGFGMRHETAHDHPVVFLMGAKYGKRVAVRTRCNRSDVPL
ncbi:MAG: hypothetical protein RLN69_11060, partial [Woeseiaceae bacterium]